AMAVSDFLCIIGWISIFLTKDIMWLDLGRLSVGCGIGLLSYVVISDHFLGVLSITQINWRFFFSGTFPCFLQLLSLFFIPESPRWLVSHLDLCHDFEVLSAMVGKDNEFEVVLKRLRGEHSDVSQEAEEILNGRLLTQEFTVNLQKLPQSGMLDLFQKKYLHAVIVSVHHLQYIWVMLLFCLRVSQYLNSIIRLELDLWYFSNLEESMQSVFMQVRYLSQQVK
ncbi:hypothetical protein BHE74_00049778, partial [Ensete ventricosum]